MRNLQQIKQPLDHNMSMLGDGELSILPDIPIPKLPILSLQPVGVAVVYQYNRTNVRRFKQTTKTTTNQHQPIPRRVCIKSRKDGIPVLSLSDKLYKFSDRNFRESRFAHILKILQGTLFVVW